MILDIAYILAGVHKPAKQAKVVFGTRVSIFIVEDIYIYIKKEEISALNVGRG